MKPSLLIRIYILLVSRSYASALVQGAGCSDVASTLHLRSPPYDNYFISDCHSAGQVVITSPLEDSNLAIVSPRVIFAWPAGNSAALAYFAPSNGVNGTLGIRLVNSTVGSPLGAIYEANQDAPGGSGNATCGIATAIEFNSSAILTLAILGSTRTIRDFVEGPSLLRPEIQSANKYELKPEGVAIVSRLWLDNITTTAMSFTPLSNQGIRAHNDTILFEPGTYFLNASFNYPQLKQLSPREVLRPEALDQVTAEQDQVNSLAFLSYDSKLLAGAWRFLTYFGRDSMIAALLLQPVLSTGKGGAIEAVVAAVLERVNATDGSVCHEETIGDYATWLHLQDNVTSTAPQCDYKMIDSDYYLPILMDRYFVQTADGSSRHEDFLGATVSFSPTERNLTYGHMALLTAERIVKLATPFAAAGNQTRENLLHLREGEVVGQWRDSTFGIGGGRIPFDVNAALAPAALRSIASLARAGVLKGTPDLATRAEDAAAVWETQTLQFFDVSVEKSLAETRIRNYVNVSSFPGPSQLDALEGDMSFPALALDGNNHLPKVEVMHTDTAFRLFLVNDTEDAQLSRFINDTAKSILYPFPAGLMTDVGLLVANPAYGGDLVYAKNWTSNAYHGTVVWSWQLAIMARGLELQLSRCSTSKVPGFCSDRVVYTNVRSAYNKLWDSIEANKDHLSTEVWSWTYLDNKIQYIDLGSLPPPPGQNPTESDIVQLWSLTFLAVKRNKELSGDD